MNRRSAVLLSVLSVFGLLAACAKDAATAPTELAEGHPGEKTKAGPVDILARVREQNSGKTRPGTGWKKGHVTNRKFDPKAVKKTANGFEIRMPSGAPVPTPTVYKDKLYVGGGFRSKEFYCFDAKTGKPIWGRNLDDDGPSSAVVEDDVVIVNTESCTIFALDANTGEQLWSYWLGDPLMSAPMIQNGLVYTSYPVTHVMMGKRKVKPKQRTSHALACFELRTGKVVWQKWIDGDVMSAPVGTGDEVLATTFPGTLYRFDAKTGDIKEAKKVRATSAPVVAFGGSVVSVGGGNGGAVFFTQRADGGVAGEAAKEGINLLVSGNPFEEQEPMAVKRAPHLDSSVQEVAEYSKQSLKNDAANGFSSGAPAGSGGLFAMRNIGQSTVSALQAFQGSRILIVDGRNYTTMGDELLCNDPKTGETVWSYKLKGDLKKLGGSLGTAPAMAGGDLFVATVQGTVLQIDPAKGGVKKTYKIGAPVRFQPAIVNGRIYVGTQTGRVICIDTGKAELTGWSTWGGNSQHTGQAK